MVAPTPAGTPTDRIVYVVLAHRLPDQVVRLVRLLLSDPDSAVVLHYDGLAPPVVDERLVWVERQPVEWGRASIPGVFLAAMAKALSVPGCAWVVFLSGQDYPLRPLALIRRELLASPHDVHADSQQVGEGHPWPLWEPLTRYGYRYTYTPPLPGRVRRHVWRLINKSCQGVQRRADASRDTQPWSVLPPIVLRNVGAQLAVGIRRRSNPFAATGGLHAGDAWFSIRAPAAQEVLQGLRDDPAYWSYMRTTIVPDEAFFQSLFALRLPHLSIGPWRRHRVFRPGESHPAVWVLSDLAGLKATGADFARKFDHTVDESVLDELDSLVRPS